MGRTVSILTFFIIAMSLTFLFGPKALAIGRYHVFDVRKNLQMSNTDPIVRDYYINAGSRDGLREKMVVNIIRREPMHDLYSDIQDDLVIPVGRLKLIVVQKTLSIGRVVSSRTPTEGPILNHAAIMSGDRVDLGSAILEDEEGAKGVGGEPSANSKGKSKEPMRASPITDSKSALGSSGPVDTPKPAVPPAPPPSKPQTAKLPQVPEIKAPKEIDPGTTPEDNSLYEDDDSVILPQ